MGFPQPQAYTLQCEWGECRETLELMDDFYVHLDQHFWAYVSSISLEAGTTLICQWCECNFATTNSHDLIRHLYFHGFHTKVKWLGYLKHCECKSGPCHSHQNRNIIPELPDGFKCCWENCYLVADIPDKFYEHVTDHAVIADPEKLSNGKMGFKCHWEGCKYEYGSSNGTSHCGRHKLKGHLTTHTQERCYACPWCGNLYVNKTKLIDHFTRQIRVEDHNYQCTHCSRTFASERILKDHMRHHVNHYQCPKCAMTCPNPSALKHHIRYKHSTARPYSCEFCDYRSKEPHDMEKHMELHQSDITYHCQVEGCDYEVRSLQNLRYHYRLKHGSGDGKYYACHLCAKTYSTGHQLTHHLRKVHRFQWPPGHCRFRYKECEDGFYRLQIFRYESIELTKQISLNDIDAIVDDGDNQGSAPSTSMANHIEPITKSSALPKKITAKRKKSSVVNAKSTANRKVPATSRTKKVQATRKSTQKAASTVTTNMKDINIENDIATEDFPAIFEVSTNSVTSTPLQQNPTTSTSLRSWLSTGSAPDNDTAALNVNVDTGSSPGANADCSLQLQELSNVEEPNIIEKLLVMPPFTASHAALPESSQSNIMEIAEVDVASNSEESLSRFLDEAFNNIPLHFNESCQTAEVAEQPEEGARCNILDGLLGGEQVISSTVVRPSPKFSPSTKQKILRVKKRLKLPTGEQSNEHCNYVQWIKECSLSQVPISPPIFPNHHQLDQKSSKASTKTSTTEIQEQLEHTGSSGSITYPAQSFKPDGSSKVEGTETSPAKLGDHETACNLSECSNTEKQLSKLINVGGKQIVLSHIDDTLVEVNGERHFLVSGKDEGSDASVYCLVKASQLENVNLSDLSVGG